jgi:glutamine synthetase
LPKIRFYFTTPPKIYPMTFRFSALRDVIQRQPLPINVSSGRISDYYGQNVFSTKVMREYLTDEAYASVMSAAGQGQPIDRRVADQVASSMKDWALSKGATHYTHWFQPLTGSTAEKHDSFMQPTGDGRAIEKFDGSQLTQQEPDASSFPSGGIRNTFEARGYTVWDPSSPAFVIGNTLCIPTIFISYTGHALDYKVPLLKSVAALDSAALPVCQYFDKDVKRITITLGCEQEYFLIDKALLNARPDIALTGRALFGHNPAKGQQLDDHYFGSIPERVMSFMREFEYECHRLAIPVTTRHNEVAPNQFEVAPIFEEVNLANDHNQLMMDIMDKVALKHNFSVLLHEKPFEGLNGSGKHNNWSLATDTGVNLLKPGKNPKSNLQFLTFFVNTIKAIHDNADVLRASIASAGNDHRLGANEAPPAIVSTFIGTHLSEILDDIERNVKAGKMSPEDKTEIKLEIGKIPQVLRDNTDRNRTSPFAFTGNKFEFRAVGSSANCGNAMIVLNTIVANQLLQFRKEVDALIDKGQKKDEAILQQLQKLIKESKNIRFEGNGYGEEWRKEAERRGLSNLKDTPAALKVWKDKKVQKIFENLQVLTAEEMEARWEVDIENYILKRQIECRVCGDIAINHVIPTAIAYQSKLLNNVNGLVTALGEKEAKSLASTQLQLIREISEHINAIKKGADDLLEKRKKANNLKDVQKKAEEYAHILKPIMDDIRKHSDALEMMIDDEMWPMPKLREILFTR